MGWRRMYGPWGGYGPMMGQMPWTWGPHMHHGMRCPCCGRPMHKPSREEMIQRLEDRKKMLEWALERTNKRIEKLKAQKPEKEEEHEHGEEPIE